MTYSAYAVANAFVQRAQEGRLEGLSSMKLQKLMYFAHAWHLKVRQTPLVTDIFIRWTHGPLIPCIQSQYQAYGNRPVLQTVRTLSGDSEREHWRTPVIPDWDDDAWGLVDAIIDRYGKFSARALSDLTHEPDSAWSRGEPNGSVIPNDMIRVDPTI
ncbi:hypothetical protein CDN99_17565 [Roseateles aquatilis]|uniref:Antitoxin SocA-like Panacea domain-containing protein n=1 Tax=Roseateles aquatilis TaxID=431061 RepID=A0A246J5A3_9BURK|nr:type II toxin-antitoxin system antitoxin SocA domain-containing protein [Roseateles aquatilis]OWQ87702.1 hypothetical protein CDN99_17565 [Roseateles aquatilis]